MACRVLVNVVNAVREVNWAQGTHGVAGVFILGNCVVTNADAALCHHRGSGQADFGSCPGVVPRCKARELSALLWVAFLVRRLRHHDPHLQVLGGVRGSLVHVLTCT